MQPILEHAHRIQDTPEVRKLIILIAGLSGAGKSTFVNAVTGIHRLANAAASDKSCSNVAISYEGPLVGQTKKYAASVLLLDHEDIRSLLESILRNFREWPTGDPLRDLRADVSALSDAGQTAWEVLRSLFGTQPNSNPSKQHASSSERWLKTMQCLTRCFHPARS
jgi:energy-coupling factor transporter ATP-binding protein EcfA2